MRYSRAYNKTYLLRQTKPTKVQIVLSYKFTQSLAITLKGKFSSGIEGALASTLNRNFNWKQLSEMILCIILLMFSKFI